MDTVRIFDTTLRDGEQSPGGTLTLPEKLEIARHLEAMGVDIIEAGFPISSPGDFESVQTIAAEIKRSVVCGLARSTPKDIERAGEAIKHAAKSRIHIFCATSKIHRDHKLRKGKEEIIRISVESVKQARAYTSDIEFSPEDASRTELEFLEEIVQAVVEAGATTINLPDTVGYATPKTYGEIFSHLLKKLPILRERKIILSAHCHDDLGLAVANSLSAVESGARQVECTINGIGERAGNAALEEIVMAIRTRQRSLQDQHAHRHDQDLSRQPHGQLADRPGRAAQQGDRRRKRLRPRSRHSPGRRAEISRDLRNHGPGDASAFPPTRWCWASTAAATRFAIASRNWATRVTDEQIEAAFVEVQSAGRQEEGSLRRRHRGADRRATGSLARPVGAGRPASLLRLQHHPHRHRDAARQQRRKVQDASIGDGPVDAIYSAIQRLTGIQASLADYRIRAVTRGKEAQGEVQLELDHSGSKVRGRGLSTDILEASALAYLAAINRLRTLGIAKRKL